MNRRRAILYGLILTTACFALADEISDVALTWVIVEHTGSAAWTGLAGAIGLVPAILGAFFGGVLVDRIGVRRSAQLAGGFGLAVAIAIPVLLSQVGVVLPLLLAIVFAAELFDTPAEIAIEAKLPELARLGGMPLERVNGLDELVETLAGLSGPLIAGASLAAFGAVTTLWLVAAVAAVGVIILWLALPRRRRDGRRRGAEPLHRSIKASLVFIWQEPVLRWIAMFAVLSATLLAGLDGVLLPYLVQSSGRTALELGWVIASAAAGAALGMAVYAWKGERLPARLLISIGIIGIAASTAVLALVSEVWLWCLAVALAGLTAGPVSPLLNTQFQARAPRSRRGAILGVSAGLILLAMPAGLLGLGLAAELIGIQATLLAIAAVFAVASLAPLAMPVLPAAAARSAGARTPPHAQSKDERP